jgi:feruloyl-CoA synthase
VSPAFWAPRFEIDRRADGCILMRQPDALPSHPRTLPDSLVGWAAERPAQVWLAERQGAGWREVTYGAALPRVRRLATALLGLGLGAQRPLLILSGSSIDHALLAMAAMYAGIPYAPVSTAYSLVSTDHARLRDIAALLRPGAVFASDGAAYGTALAAVASPGRHPIVASDVPTGALSLADLEATAPGGEAEAAFAALTPASVGKYLFTSGSTGVPKAVINSQGMMTANQAMVADCFRFLAERPPVVVDWAPWNHTASGNKVFNMVLTAGGTYAIDDGRPSPALIGRTVENLTLLPPTWYFNVPVGWEMLVAAMERDAGFRNRFFSRLDMMMYAGAGMAQHTWAALKRLSREATGREVPLTTGLGATETAPFALMCTDPQERPGNVGVPAKGITLKLVPAEGRLEARLKGPSVTAGYLGDPKATADTFDDEGFYRLGDALRPADPDDLSKGFFFDGRVAENFKLRTGTWVAVGPLRAALVDALGGLVRDAVIVGEDREALAALMVPDPDAFARLGEGATLREQAASATVRAALAERLAAFAARATGSATRVTRALVLTEPLSLDRGEVTDKGSVNQRAVIRARADLVVALYSDDPRVILATG